MIASQRIERIETGISGPRASGIGNRARGHMLFDLVTIFGVEVRLDPRPGLGF